MHHWSLVSDKDQFFKQSSKNLKIDYIVIMYYMSYHVNNPLKCNFAILVQYTLHVVNILILKSLITIAS